MVYQANQNDLGVVLGGGTSVDIMWMEKGFFLGLQICQCGHIAHLQIVTTNMNTTRTKASTIVTVCPVLARFLAILDGPACVKPLTAVAMVLVFLWQMPKSSMQVYWKP